MSNEFNPLEYSPKADDIPAGIYKVHFDGKEWSKKKQALHVFLLNKKRAKK